MFKIEKNIAKACLSTNSTFRDVLVKLLWGGQAVFFIDKKAKLLGSISDGDIRKALINGAQLDDIAFEHRNPFPFSVTLGTQNLMIEQIMSTKLISALPIVNKLNQIVSLAKKISVSDLAEQIPNKFFIFAGGRGERLRPFTNNCPKPMLEVAGKPIILHIIEKARAEGFFNFLISINYLGDRIKDYFGNGEKYSVNIDYIKEDSPLGTAGALSLMYDKINEPMIVTNGDVLSDVSYFQLLEYSIQNNADACVALSPKSAKLDYGLVSVVGTKVTEIREKPTITHLMNAGIYVLAPTIIELLECGKRLDITDLLTQSIKMGKAVVGYQLHEEWQDIGNPSDLYKVNKDYTERKI